MLGKLLTRSQLNCRGVQVGSTMERVKQVAAKFGCDQARQTLGSVRVKQGADLVGDGREVSIYPLIRSSTPQSHHFALVTALGMLPAFRRELIAGE